MYIQYTHLDVLEQFAMEKWAIDPNLVHISICMVRNYYKWLSENLHLM